MTDRLVTLIFEVRVTAQTDRDPTEWGADMARQLGADLQAKIPEAKEVTVDFDDWWEK